MAGAFGLSWPGLMRLEGIERMNKYGPTRGELQFRIVVSILGLCLMGFALWYRGVPDGPALVEVVGLASVFFGGTLILSVRRLIKVSTSEPQ